MEIARINPNGAIEVGHYSQFKTVTFPATKQQILEGGFIECCRYKPHDPLTERLEEVAPYIEDGKCFLVSVQQLTQAEIDERKYSSLMQLKQRRNAFLNDCAWTQQADERAVMGPTRAAEWDVYRQAVRDVPYLASQNDPRIQVTWPTPPGA